jgi:hypothetical protein
MGSPTRRTFLILAQENQGRNSAIHRLWREVTAASARPYAGMYTHASVSRVSMIEYIAMPVLSEVRVMTCRSFYI